MIFKHISKVNKTHDVIVPCRKGQLEHLQQFITVKEPDFNGEFSSVQMLYGTEGNRVYLLGIGEEKDAVKIDEAFRKLSFDYKKYWKNPVQVIAEGLSDAELHKAIIGLEMSAYNIGSFKTKEDLAYEVTIGLLNEWNAYQRGVFNKLEGSGIERLEFFLNKLIDHMSKKPDVMRYLSEFDFYFKDESNSANEASMSRFNEIILESESLLNEIMILGKEDKSIKENLDAKLMVATMSNVLWSFAQRIAIRGEIIKKESGLDGITLIKNQVDIYIMFIRKD